MTEPASALAAPAEAAEQPTLLCVDDEANILSALRRLFRPCGYKVHVAGSGAEGLELLAREHVDLVISDMRMPIMDGARFLEQVRSRWPETVRLLLTGYADIESAVAAINNGGIYRYIAKPWQDSDLIAIVREALEFQMLRREKARLEALTQRQNDELKQLNASLEDRVRLRTAELQRSNDRLVETQEKLKQHLLTSIRVFSNLLDLRGGTLAGHSRRVADMARRIAQKMELPPNDIQDVMLAGLLHDIGKIGYSDSLIAKPMTALAGEDYVLVRKHSVAGQNALMALPNLAEAAKLIRSHHERWDGKGFPDCLIGPAIPLGARILAVANEFDSLQIGTFDGHRRNPAEAAKLIEQSSGKRYDPKVVEAFRSLMGVEAKPTHEREIKPHELEPGMVLSRDIFSRDGVLLLAADYILDAGIIRQIGDYAKTDASHMTLYIRTDVRHS